MRKQRTCATSRRELQATLDKTRGDLETARKEKACFVDTRLKETNSKSWSELRNYLDDAKKSEHQVRDQLAQLQEPVKDFSAKGRKVTVTRTRQLRAPKLPN